MSSIIGVHGREIIDSRGNPTVEVEVWLDSGASGRAAVPSGASTGTYEAVELRDGGPRYNGKGVLKAVNGVNEKIAPEIMGFDADDQAELDAALMELDGTPNKGELGANAILGVSLATARAAADDHDMPLWAWIGGLGPFSLPTPMMNVINGGAHADNNVDIQEFMIVPHGAETFAEALRMGVENLPFPEEDGKSQGYSTAIGDEGGFAPTEEQPGGHRPHPRGGGEGRVRPRQGREPGPRPRRLRVLQGWQVPFRRREQVFSAEEMVDYWEELCRDYPILSIEDGMAEDDWAGWAVMTSRLGKKIQIVGDDLFVTNPEKLSRGIEEGVANAVLIKLNQIGTLSETLNVIALAKRYGYGTIISHRSGETDDSFISDLSVATGAGQIKTGAPARIDRVAKYNQLLRIAEDLERAPYARLSQFRGNPYR